MPNRSLLDELEGGRAPKTPAAKSGDGDDDSHFELQTHLGYGLDEASSALQKAIRRGRENEAMFWAHELWPTYSAYFWRRMMTIVSEDCCGDPMTAVIVGQLAANADRQSKGFKSPVSGIIEAQAVLVCVRAVKSKEAVDFLGLIKEAKQNGLLLETPDYAIDLHTRKGKAKGRTQADFIATGRGVAEPVGPNAADIPRWGKKTLPYSKPGEPAVEGRTIPGNEHPDIVLFDEPCGAFAKVNPPTKRK